MCSQKSLLHSGAKCCSDCVTGFFMCGWKNDSACDLGVASGRLRCCGDRRRRTLVVRCCKWGRGGRYPRGRTGQGRLVSGIAGCAHISSPFLTFELLVSAFPCPFPFPFPFRLFPWVFPLPYTRILPLFPCVCTLHSSVPASTVYPPAERAIGIARWRR